VETVTLTINGKAISARAGRTVLEVARQHGIYIPTLCHHDALRPIGACRLCQVEDEKRGVVVPSCVTQISQGMVINTDSERVIRNRRNIIRMLMAAHPESCVVCEKGNRCELRNLAARMGVGAHGLDPMPYSPQVLDLNPFMTRDLSKCIMCAKCVRADQEVVCEGVIDYNMRGFDAHPATLFGSPLEGAECTFCGTCLAVCPTGAIAEKNKPRLDHAGHRTRGVCSYCACGCAIYWEHDGTMVRAVSPAGDVNSTNGISLCVRGHFGHDYLNNKDRLVSPLIRTDDGFRPAPWDEALDLIATKWKEIRDANDTASMGFMGGARSSNEENYLFQKLARQVVGTNNLDFAARVQMAPAMQAIRGATGFGAGTSSFRDVEKSRVIMVIGADPTRTAPVLGYHIKRATRLGGRHLILIDPVETKLAGFAETWLRPKPASDVYVLRGIIKTILEEDLSDRQFVATKTRRFEDFESRFEKVSVSECANAAGLDEIALRQAARTWAGAESGFLIFGQGLFGQAMVPELAGLAVDLVLIAGHLGKDNSGLIPLFKESNAQGALDMGVAPGLLPGQVTADSDIGLDGFSMLEAAREGRMKSLFIMGENTAARYPDTSSVKKALENVPFLVVMDMFMTETAQLADVILPSAAWSEKSGTATNLERRIQWFEKAVPTPGDFPDDLSVLIQLANRLGADWSYSNASDVLAEIEQTTPLYSELTTTRKRNGAVFWPQPGLEEVPDTLPHGIGHPDGRAIFLSVFSDNGPPVITSDNRPFMLMQGHVLHHLASGARSSQSRRLLAFTPEPVVYLAPSDMESLGLTTGSMVCIASDHGEVTATAADDAGLPPGMVFLPSCFESARANQLFGWIEPGQTPAIKHCAVSLAKAD
jgi:formate dehydrogenase alpha subunit